MIVGQILDENEIMLDSTTDKMNSSNIWINIELKSFFHFKYFVNFSLENKEMSKFFAIKFRDKKNFKLSY